jgi:hypothetical protein
LLSESQRAYEEHSFFSFLDETNDYQEDAASRVQMCMIGTEGFGVRVNRQMGNGHIRKGQGRCKNKKGIEREMWAQIKRNGNLQLCSRRFLLFFYF